MILALDTYVALTNLSGSDTLATLTFMTTAGPTVTVGATSRATVTIPAWVPAGSVGVSLTAPLVVAVERLSGFRTFDWGTYWSVVTGRCTELSMIADLMASIGKPPPPQNDGRAVCLRAPRRFCLPAPAVVLDRVRFRAGVSKRG